MRLWWRWTWRSWVGTLAMLVFAAGWTLFFNEMRFQGLALPELFVAPESWLAPDGLVRMAYFVSLGCGSAAILSAFQVVALAPALPFVSYGRWVLASAPLITCEVILSMIYPPEEARLVHVLFGVAIGLATATSRWVVVFSGRTSGLVPWLFWQTLSAGILVGLDVTVIFGALSLYLTPALAIAITCAIYLAGVAIGGIGAAALRPRQRDVANVFA